MKYYTARWAQPGKPARGNVSYNAASDSNAIRRADKLAREIDCVNTPRTIMRDGILIECIQTGVSQ